jgi:hypothetical protein
VADRPYGELYDLYSVSPEYFGYTLVHEVRNRNSSKYFMAVFECERFCAESV